jgi:hypothetical protein
MAGEVGREERMFFFEKKNQKTFIPGSSRAPAARAHPNE